MKFFKNILAKIKAFIKELEQDSGYNKPSQNLPCCHPDPSYFKQKKAEAQIISKKKS